MSVSGGVTNTVKYYYAGTERIAMRQDGGAVKWLLGDHLGSTSLVYDGSETIRQGYKAWGERRFILGGEELPTTFRYTGQREEASIGLYYYGARWYDPVLAKFIHTDIIVSEPWNSQSYDRFSYVYNNPINNIDPTGNWTETQLKDILGEDWYKKYFGEDGFLKNRYELLKFLRSKSTTDSFTLEIIGSLLKVAYGLNELGYSFDSIDAIGARFSGSGGSVAFGSLSFDAVLNLTSGEFSAFISPEGGVILGASAVAVGGITLIHNMPSNSSFLGTFKNIGGMAGIGVGINIEGLYGGDSPSKSSGTLPNGLFVGVTGGLPNLNVGIYGSLSYSFEALCVDSSGYGWGKNLPTSVWDVFFDIGEVIMYDILGIQ
jgi:RHS repeat-associated protein